MPFVLNQQPSTASSRTYTAACAHSDGLVEMTAEGGIHMMPGYPRVVHNCRISGAPTSVVYLRMDRGVSVEQAELKLAECMAARKQAAARRAAVAASQVRPLVFINCAFDSPPLQASASDLLHTQR
jgi:hypothetical protein